MALAHRKRTDAWGNALSWLCGGALAFNLLLVVGLLGLIAANGLHTFWPRRLTALTLVDGSKLLGEIHDREAIPIRSGEDPSKAAKRIHVKVGNRDFTGIDFVWVDERRIVDRSMPEDVVALERVEYGNFYGRLVELRRGVTARAAGTVDVLRALDPLHENKRREVARIEAFERREIGDVNREIERLRLSKRKLALDDGVPSQTRALSEADLDRRVAEKEREYEALASRLFAMRQDLVAETVVLEAANGARKELPVSQIVRVVRPNAMGTVASVGLFLSRLWEFVSAKPRESNTEGGIFPAIFGTVLMVFLMSFAVAPLGVLAALYLREYARQGTLVRIVRIAVNNLAGVPSIVFGVFGLGFFVYLVGGSIDRLFYAEALPTPTFGTGGILWASLTLALLTVPVVIVATEEGLAAVPRVVREGALALGATRFETTWRVVIPAAAPGILTGMILAMARAAGEVAPLMIVGMVKLASLPVDGHFPFLHPERKFMHLGFHIYDVGLQSPNVEATKPLVFATALLLVLVVTAMNLIAISVRNHLRRKYASSAV